MMRPHLFWAVWNLAMVSMIMGAMLLNRMVRVP